MHQFSPTTIGILLASLAFSVAGLAAIPFRFALDTLPPLTVVYGVFIGALIFSFPGLAIQRISLKVDRSIWGALVAVALLGVLGNYAICKAILTISPTLAVTIQRSEIIIAILLSWIVLKEKLTLRLWFGVGLAMVGIVFIKQDGLLFSIQSWLPILWAIVSATSFAAMQIVVKTIINQINPQALNTWRLLISLVILSITPGQWSQTIAMDWKEWGWVMLAGFLGPFAARVIYTYALRYIPVSLAVLLSTSAPISTLLAEYLILDHLLNWYEALGCFLILVGIVWPLIPAQKGFVLKQPK